MKHLNFTYLQYFYDAAVHRSVSIAARENHVSQSAISQGIAKLEIELGAKLTTHQRQAFRLTEEGDIIFNGAKKLFSAVSDLKDNLSALKGEISGEISFSCTNSLAQFYLPSAYLKMRKDYPRVNIQFHRGSLKYIHESLKKEEVNFALVLDGPEYEVYDREIISKGYFRLYQSKSLKKSPGIIVDHLENDEVVELRERYKQRYGEELKILEALSGWALVLAFVELRHGTGYLPEFMGSGRHDLKEVELDIPLIQYSLCMIKLKGTAMTRAEKAFLKILRHSSALAVQSAS